MRKLTLVLLLFVSCSRDNNSPVVDPNAPTSGTWRVSLFSERGNNETSDFNGYTFTFGNTGTATASKSGTTKNGTWNISSNKFNLDLGVKSDANKPLGELTDDWKIISVNTNEIKLTDDNASSAEFLTFTKN
ncbi:hypothetical protein [Chitinophaga niabensis]|uniref:Lipocalin-like domain-containing protein n=1 Tax=Chitinophaga niabensis TaxID=536979 RepID=A0A1N6G4M2_9BACT|nr:hypothetical protein [Chitinophaga niabensis]SIO02457.1 hypothetical protein SAMN04488055_2575 [Chitinophaga niabensis]